MQYVTLAALCVTLASSTYLVRDLLRPKHLGFRDLTLGPRVFPNAGPSSAIAEAQTSASPESQQHQELAAVSETQSAVASAPINEPSSSSVESTFSPPSVTEDSPISQLEATIVWSPIVSGVSSGAPPNPSTVEARTSASPESPQHQELAAVSETQPAVATAPINEPSSPSVESTFSLPSVTENSPISQLETTIVWSPIVSGVSPGARRNPSTVTLEKREVESGSGTVVIGQPLASRTNVSANTQSLPSDKSRPERKATGPEDNGTPPQKFGVLSSKLLVGVTSPDHLLKNLEGAQKARQTALTQSSARLYLSKPTPPPKAPPPQQLVEPEASSPPVQETEASKNASLARATGTGITGDLRRFAASYLQADEGEDVKSQAGYYAGSVHFYNEGDLSWTRIAAATHRYHQASRQRRYVISAASVRGPVNGGFWIIEQPFSWTKTIGTRVQTGKSVLRMSVIPSGRGNFEITSIGYE